MMLSLGLLVSGSLGHNVLSCLEANNHIVFVMTDENSDKIIAFCDKKKIDCYVGNPREGRCSNFIHNLKIDILISISYLFLIEKDLITLPKGIAFNIHGSLLPKFRGRTPHVWAIINNEKETGITAHKMDIGCDTGDIIEQVVIPIENNDTGADLLTKFKNNYILLVKSVLEKLANNSIVLKKQDHTKASFFGKRTPDDGHIFWDWQKERIHNWVRAQAHPYPGAFTYLGNTKIIIDEISYTDRGFSYDMPNGLVLSIDPVLVKTPNGVVKLEKFRETKAMLKVNQILN